MISDGTFGINSGGMSDIAIFPEFDGRDPMQTAHRPFSPIAPDIVQYSLPKIFENLDSSDKLETLMFKVRKVPQLVQNPWPVFR